MKIEPSPIGNSAFAAFTTDELLAEIVRRRNARVSRRPIPKCESCKNFVPKADGDDSYNPCAKGHEMSFRMPDPDDGPPDENGDWGFFLRVCPDRDLS